MAAANAMPEKSVPTNNNATRVFPADPANRAPGLGGAAKTAQAGDAVAAEISE